MTHPYCQLLQTLQRPNIPYDCFAAICQQKTTIVAL
jgi:hypothetical protein